MRLQIKNFAKIKEADITLDGITVIAGENNTGKSTVGKILCAFYNSFYNYESQIKFQKKARIQQILFKNLDADILFPENNIKTQKFEEIVNKYFNDEYTDDQLFKLLKNFNNLNVTNVMEDIKTSKGISNTKILYRFITSIFVEIFNGQINNLNNKELSTLDITIEGKTTKLNFDKNVCTNIENPINIKHSAIFLDNPNVLNYISNKKKFPFSSLSNRRLRRRLFKTYLRPYIEENSNEGDFPNIYDDIITSNKLEKIFELLNLADNGKVERQEDNDYLYVSNNIDKPLVIDNLSMGLKSFVLLRTLLENKEINEKDILILDEPEIHLHPKWQLLYAQILVLLQVTFDLTLVITSHSPYFIDAINLYAAEYDALKNCNFYLSEMEDNEVTIENVTSCIDKIYEKLADPFDILDTLRYELQEAGKLC